MPARTRSIRLLTGTGVAIGAMAAALQAAGAGSRAAVACVLAWLILTIAAMLTPPGDWAS